MMSSRRMVYHHDPPADELRSAEIFQAFDIFDIEFQTQKYVPDDYKVSLPFWMCRRSSTDSKCSSSSKLHAVSDGRTLLMELIQSIPESSYELSLRDIVNDQQQSLQEDEQYDHQVIMMKGKSQVRKPEIKIQKMKKTSRRSLMESNQSMDNGLFLLKMFIPVSFCFMMKQKNIKNCSKFLPETSLDEFDNQVLERREKKKARSKYQIIWLKNRLAETGNFLSCWIRFLWRKKSS